MEELWRLFPIFLTEHQNIWKTWYNDEAKRLESILPCDYIKRVSHIGSTSVNSIWAKPIIDILIEVVKDCNMSGIKNLLTDNGYTCMSEEEERLSFNKGYTINGFDKKVFHLHLRYLGDNDELYFRDYLIDNPETAKEYEKLKLTLWEKFEHDRDGYTSSKTAFVSECTKKAKELYYLRY